MRNPDLAGTPALLPSRTEMERAFAARDGSYDGVFFVAVRTTGIFCRPSCPSRPRPENVEFLASVRDCLFAGYRPCRRCRPTEVDGSPPEWVEILLKRVEARDDGRVGEADYAAAGATPERARRWFLEHHGMTFTAWCRAHRLGEAFTRIREGVPLEEAGLDAGFESQSGFREAFRKVFGAVPGRAREGAGSGPIVLGMIETPLGPVVGGAREEGVCLLEFADRRMLEANLARLRRRFGSPLVPGEHPVLDRLRAELAEYFAGQRRRFEVPVSPCGTAFQREVWEQLLRIPYGGTWSYEELARRVGRPAASRAVAGANGMNGICILIPCHRVIGKDGELAGYGAGVWRKRLLLELERTGRLPR